MLPVNGTREALFAFAQAVIDTLAPSPIVGRVPNPFYQIYEGAALLAGAEPVFLNQTDEQRFALDLDSLTERPVARGRSCSTSARPAIRPGACSTLDDWRALFERVRPLRLRDRVRRVLLGDLSDEARRRSARSRRRSGSAATDFRNLVVFTSLSKRSNVPGLRSGAVAGDAALLKQFLLYRTYHGCAMSLPVQHASIAAWSDEAHVRENRALYREKFDARRADARSRCWTCRGRTPASTSGRACRAATTRRLRGTCLRRRT